MDRRALAGLALLSCAGGGTSPVGPVAPPEPTTSVPAPHSTPPAPVEGVTWEHVAPILEARCVTCHQAGQIAPFPLDTHEAAAAWAPVMAEVTRERLMPPYLVDPTGACGEYVDPGWLTDAELDTLDAWAAAGAPLGDGPTGRLVAPGVDHVDPPDAVLDVGVEFTPTEHPDEYRCFLVDPELTSDAFLTAFEVLPGNPSIVHHANLHALDSPAALLEAQRLDRADATPGWPCYGSIGVSDARQVSGWAPGTPATRFPEGTGVRLRARMPMVLVVHFHSEASGESDRTRVNLDLEETVAEEAYVVTFMDETMVLPPGEPELVHVFEPDASPLAGTSLGARVWGVFPHMHERGVAMSAELLRDGGATCLSATPRYDFEWQRSFFYREPVAVDASDGLRITCVYDTSADTEPVRFGESTEDEMCLYGFLVTR